MILLGIFTLAESYMVSNICGLYTPESILQAAVATAGATFGLTVFAYTTNYDFTEWVHFFYGKIFLILGFCWSFVMIIVWVIFLNLFFLIHSSLLLGLYAAVFAVIYSIYILIDTQMIMGGKKYEISLDNYVFGAVMLYIDIIGLFLKLLRLLGERR